MFFITNLTIGYFWVRCQRLKLQCSGLLNVYSKQIVTVWENNGVRIVHTRSMLWLEHKSIRISLQLVSPPLHGVSDHVTESGRFGLAHRESVSKIISAYISQNSILLAILMTFRFGLSCCCFFFKFNFIYLFFQHNTFWLYQKNFGAPTLISGRHGNWEAGTERRKSHTTES